MKSGASAPSFTAYPATERLLNGLRKAAHFIDSDDPGGAETLVVEICRRLEDWGYRGEVYHFGNIWLKNKCDELGIASVMVPGKRFYKSAKTLPLFSLLFARFLRQRKVDILHSHLFGSITGAALSAFLTGIPHIGTIHDTYTIEEKTSRARLLKTAAFLGTRLVAVSAHMRDYLKTLVSFPASSFQLISNGVDIHKFNGPWGMMRSRLGLNADDIVLVCVGRLVEIKGHDTLLKAFELLPKRRPVKLLIVGDGPERGKYEGWVSLSGLKDRVKMLGQREDIPAILRSSDCFVLASRSEGLSCSIIEAMAAGLPVAATDVGGNSELVSDGWNGYLVPPDDPAALAEKLAILIDNESERKRFGERSLETAVQKFSLDVMLKEYVRNYDSMLKGRR